MAGSHEDGRTVLNFRPFLKKTGITRVKPLPAAAAVGGPDAAESEPL